MKQACSHGNTLIHLFVKGPQPGDSEGTFSSFKSSRRLLPLKVEAFR